MADRHIRLPIAIVLATYFIANTIALGERINDFDTSRQSNFTPYLAAMVKQGDRAAFELAVQSARA